MTDQLPPIGTEFVLEHGQIVQVTKHLKNGNVRLSQTGTRQWSVFGSVSLFEAGRSSWSNGMAVRLDSAAGQSALHEAKLRDLRRIARELMVNFLKRDSIDDLTALVTLLSKL